VYFVLTFVMLILTSCLCWTWVGRKDNEVWGDFVWGNNLKVLGWFWAF